MKIETSLLVEVHPAKTRCYYGAMDVKNILFEELFNKVNNLDFNNLSKDDKQLIEQYQAVNKMSVHINTIIPERFSKELQQLKNKANMLYKSYCISDSCNYMTQDGLDGLLDSVKPIKKKILQIVGEIYDNWEEVVKCAAETLSKASKGVLSYEDSLNVVKQKLPTKDAFKHSYRNICAYIYGPINTNFRHISGDSEIITDGKEVIACELDEIIRDMYISVLKSLDEVLTTEKMMDANPNGIYRPRKRINAAIKKINRICHILKDDETEKIVEMLEDIYNSPEIDTFFFLDVESVAKKIMDKLIKTGLLELNDYPADLKSFTKELYVKALQLS